MANEVEIIIRGNADHVKKTLKDLVKESKAAGDDIGKNTNDGVDKTFANTFKQLKTLGGIAVGLKVVYEGIQAAVGASLLAEEIRAVNKQFEILGNQAGLATDSLKAGLVSAADGLADTEDILQAANRSIIELGSSAEHLPEIMNLARQATSVFGGELVQNFEAMGHAIATGNTKALKNLGIIIDQEAAYKDYAKSIGVSVDMLNKEGKEQAILNAVMEKGKQAFAGIDTNLRENANNLQRMKVSWGELGDAAAIAFDKMFGSATKSLLSETTLSLDRLTNFLVSKFGSGTEQAAAQVKGLNQELIDLEKRKALAEKWAPGELSVIESSMKRVRNELAALNKQDEAAMMLQMKKSQAGGGAKAATDPMAGVNAQKFAEEREKIAIETEKTNAQILGSQASLYEQQGLYSLADQLKKQQVETDFQAKMSALRKQYEGAQLQGTDEFKTLEATLIAQKDQQLIGLAQNSKSVLNQIGSTMRTGIGQAAGGAFAAFGKALASGEDALGAFINSLVSAMGQMAVQLGTQFIMQGIAYTWAGMPNGPSLIAAGAALATFGGILSAVGGGGGKGSAGDTGGGVAASPSIAIEDGSATDFQEVNNEPQQTVHVNFNGLVAGDKRAIAQEISDVLLEGGFSSDVKFGAA